MSHYNDMSSSMRALTVDFTCRDLAFDEIILRYTVENAEQSFSESQEITEAVEAEVDQIPSELHHLQVTSTQE